MADNLTYRVYWDSYIDAMATVYIMLERLPTLSILCIEMVISSMEMINIMLGQF